MDEVRADQPIDLRGYLAVLRVRKWTIILVTLLVTGSALFFSFSQTPLYTAAARVLVEPIQTNPDDYYLLPPNLETETELVSSEPVARRVAKELGGSSEDLLGGVSVSSVIDSEVMVVKYTDADPALAQAAANSFATSYLDYRVDQALQGLLAAEESVQQRADRVREQLGELTKRIETADRADNTELESTLESERSVLIARLGVLEQRLDDVNPERAVQSGGGNVIEPAGFPASPSSPVHTQNGVLGLALGLALGVGLAFLRERLDDRFRGRSDLIRATDAPVLATVPKFKVKKGSNELVSLAQPHSTVSEAYRSLRTSIQFLGVDHDLTSILVTSPAAGEGKTVTSSNLAIAFAQANNRVVLVSADLRRPTIERYFGVQSEPGLSARLLGTDRPIWEMLQDASSVPNLRILPSGKVPPNPAEILASSRLIELLNELREHADIVIIDSPPALPVADASILAAHASGTILVIDAGNTKRSAALHAKEELERVGSRFLGTVLNAYDPSASYSYYDSHYYPGYYGDPAALATGSLAESKKKKRRLSFKR